MKIYLSLKIKLKSFLRKIHIFLNTIYDYFTSKIVQCSVGDLLLIRDSIFHNQFLTASRVCDIKRYEVTNIPEFYFQTEISYAIYGKKNYNKDYHDINFVNLIKSYKNEGVLNDSFLTVDKELRLMDGNHRCALHFLLGINEVRVKVVKRKSHYKYGIDGFLFLPITNNQITMVMSEYYNIQKALIDRGDCFCFFAKEGKINVLISNLVDIKKTIKFKINKNIIINDNGKEKEFKPGSYILILFSLKAPNYKVLDNTLISKRILDIEQILNYRYSLQDTDDYNFYISKSCLQGLKAYEVLKSYF